MTNIIMYLCSQTPRLVRSSAFTFVFIFVHDFVEKILKENRAKIIENRIKIFLQKSAKKSSFVFSLVYLCSLFFLPHY
jgi:hypothetical protein